jgi:hypothetical protein
MNRRQRLDFAVRLANAGLNQATAGELMVLRETFEAWVVHGVRDNAGIGVAILVPSSARAADYTREQFIELQDDTKRLLAMAVPGDGPAGVVPAVKVEVEQALTRIDDGRTVLQVFGPARDVYLDMLFRIFGGRETDPIRRCPECGNWFVRQRRQKYCTLVCTRKVNNRTYPTTNAYLESRARQYSKPAPKGTAPQQKAAKQTAAARAKRAKKGASK